MPLQLAVATEDFSSSLKKAIGLAADCKVSGIRFNTRSEIRAMEATASSLRQILLFVKERQMKVAGLTCPTRHALYDSEYLEERLAVIRKSMSLTRQLETSELLIRCGAIPDPDNTDSDSPAKPDIHEQANPFSFAPSSPTGPSAHSKFNLLCEILNDLTQYGNHVGCELNLQLTAFDLRLVRQLLAEIKAGPLKIVFDPATAVMTGSNVTGTFRDLYDQFGYIRARDAVRNVDGAGVEVAVGDGIVDWVEFIPTLAEADYRGWICVERTGGEQRREDVRRGVSLLNSLIPKTGD